jgi:hypothetical protein
MLATLRVIRDIIIPPLHTAIMLTHPLNENNSRCVIINLVDLAILYMISLFRVTNWDFHLCINHLFSITNSNCRFGM